MSTCHRNCKSSLECDHSCRNVAMTQAMNRVGELDPLGLSPHQPGAKLDAGKNRLSLVIEGFPLALSEIGKVATAGARKYTDHGWATVPSGVERYGDALYRHLLAEAAGERNDKDTGLAHAAHAAWNALARLELLLRKSNSKPEQTDGTLRP